jgi:hypothetical protein
MWLAIYLNPKIICFCDFRYEDYVVDFHAEFILQTAGLQKY